MKQYTLYGITIHSLKILCYVKLNIVVLYGKKMYNVGLYNVKL